MERKHIEILNHALGLDDHGLGTPYRNRWVGRAQEVQPLVESGDMLLKRVPLELTGGDPLFMVTDQGKRTALVGSLHYALEDLKTLAGALIVEVKKAQSDTEKEWKESLRSMQFEETMCHNQMTIVRKLSRRVMAIKKENHEKPQTV